MSTRERAFEITRGRTIRLTELDRLGKAVERLSGISGPALLSGSSGLSLVQPQREWFYAKLTAKDGETPQAYSWTLVAPDGEGSWFVPAAAPEGTPSSLPAFEANDADLDVTGEPVVQMFFGTSVCYFFSNPPAGSLVVNGGDATFTNVDVNFTNSPVTFGGPVYYTPDDVLNVSGNVDDSPLPGTSVLVVNPTGSGPWNFTGIVAPLVDGFRLVVINKGTEILVLKNEDTGSAAANRLRCPYQQNHLFPPNFAAELQYDLTLARWRVLWISDILCPGVELWSLGADEDDYEHDLGFPSKIAVLSDDVAISGFAGGKLGYVMRIANVTNGYTLTLNHEDTGSSAANRIACPSAANYKIAEGGGVTLLYDTLDSVVGPRWHVLASREIYTTPNAVVVVGPNKNPIQKAELQFNAGQLKAIRNDGGGRPEFALTARSSSDNDLNTNDPLGDVKLQGRADGTDKDMAGLEGTYTGDGTTQTGKLHGYAYNAGTKKRGWTVNNDGTLLIEEAQTPAYLLGTHDTDGYVVPIEVGDNLDLTDNVLSATGSGSGSPAWIKITKTYSDLAAAATTNTIALHTLAIKGVIHEVVVHATQAFSGGSLVAYTLTLIADGNNLFSSYSVMSASDTTFTHQKSDNPYCTIFDFGATSAIQLRADSGGANLNAATQGSVDIYLLLSTLPS